MKHELVKDWMSRDVVTITPDTTLPEADKLMIDNTIRRLPVIQYEPDDKQQKRGRLLGIVTYGDIREARPSDASSLTIWEMNYLLANLKVSEIMSSDPVTVSQEANIAEAAQLMLKHMISGLPVVDHTGNVVGIITESDIFRMVVHEWVRTADDDAQPYVHYS